VLPFLFFKEILMRPLSRKPVSKGASTRSFNRGAGRAKKANFAPIPMRGGWRF